MINVFIVKLF
uniref:Uncharacterized protein n=1 Tax=Anguilla anguilla TaxID=7936 RepID=A0A0E9T9P6_ANGAN